VSGATYTFRRGTAETSVTIDGRVMSPRRRALGGRACRLWLCPRLRMDVRARAEIRSGHISGWRIGPCRFRCVGGVPNGAAGKCEGSRLYDVHRTAPFERSWATDERAAPITARSRSAIGATSSSGRVPVKDRKPPEAAPYVRLFLAPPKIRFARASKWHLCRVPCHKQIRI
jgi:hypothetical protein